MTTASAPLRTARALPPTRALLLVPAAVALLAGLDAALMLIGAPAPVRLDRLPDVHGMVMVLGFLGTLISLERAVALGRPVGFLAPGLLGLGGLLLISPAPLRAGATALVAGCAALTLVYLPLWRRQRDEAVLVQALGAVLATGAALMWLAGMAVPDVLPWLAGFVILTIAGERLELARLAMGSDAGSRLTVLAGGLVGGALAAVLWPEAGARVLGATLLGLTGWLAVHDVARRTITSTGLARYSAGCMLAGYFWLAATGATWLLGGPASSGERYDVVVHATFLGFAMSMVMAHAPVILPAVVRRPLPYHPAMAVAAGLLHASLALRLLAGDAWGRQGAWRVGGVLNIVALLLFIVVSAWSATAGRRRTP